MNKLDLSILKYYKNCNELCGFEPKSPWKNLCKNGYLDDDLELTHKGYDFIENYKFWNDVEEYNNKTKIVIKPTL